MPHHDTRSGKLETYSVWDRTTRVFHWINATSVFVLAMLGLAILYEDELGFSSDGIVLLKTVHVYVGYVFVVNLLWRLAWAFVGSEHARWKAILPFHAGFGAALRHYLRGFASARPVAYLGHDPLGRLMVTLLLLFLTVQAVTGLVLAGTDLYKPPLGATMADWVTGGDVDKLAGLRPGSREFVDPANYEEMRAFRKPVKNTHLYVFYALLIAIGFHVAGAVIAEIKYRNGLISAMFTGAKVFATSPVDVIAQDDESHLQNQESEHGS